ncbi:MAG TPA: SUMF1/EgtB/PvdO family nonheme iron enzyme [Polyangiaceae bacterium]
MSRHPVLALVTAVAATVVRPPAPSVVAPEPLDHEWRLIDDAHWQIVSPGATEDPEVTDAREGTRGDCGAGMVEVRGEMLDEGSGYFDVVEALQRNTCVDWITRTFPERCARFDQGRWRSVSANLPRRSMHFCIDRFEYPNLRGAFPWIMVDWNEARAICGREGKRLCTEAEWTFACEGEQASPYPYGYERDARACVIDRTWRAYKAGALFPRDTQAARAELDRLWQGEASGARALCRSPFGVYDMTGNVDEWTTSIVPGERPSILKGGYWGPVRTRCRPSTRAHGPDFSFYQQGLRCCADAARDYLE